MFVSLGWVTKADLGEYMLERILVAVVFVGGKLAYQRNVIDGWTLIYIGIILGALIIRD